MCTHSHITVIQNKPRDTISHIPHHCTVMQSLLHLQTYPNIPTHTPHPHPHVCIKGCTCALPPAFPCSQASHTQHPLTSIPEPEESESPVSTLTPLCSWEHFRLSMGMLVEDRGGERGLWPGSGSWMCRARFWCMLRLRI